MIRPGSVVVDRGDHRPFLTSYNEDRIRHALPIVPFRFRNERIQRFEDFAFRQISPPVFQLLLNFSSHRRAEVAGPGMPTFLVRLLLFDVLTTRDPRNVFGELLALAMQSNNASQRHYGFLSAGSCNMRRAR